MGLPEARIREIIESRRQSEPSPHREAYITHPKNGWVVVFDADDPPKLSFEERSLVEIGYIQ